MGCCQNTDQSIPRAPKTVSRKAKDQRIQDQQTINSRKMQFVPTLHLSQNNLYSKRVQSPLSGESPATPTSAEMSG